MAVEYDISSDVAVIKETGSVSQCARVTQMYSGQITYDDEAGSKFATATINGKSQRVMLCIAVNGTVTYDDVPSLYSTVDGHRCLNIVTPTETGTPDDVPSLYETVVIDGQNVRAVRCIMINKTPVYDGVSSTCTFTGDDGKTHTAQLVNKVTGGSVQVIIKGTSPLNLPDAIANSLSYVKAFGGTEQRDIPDNYLQRQFIYMMDGSYLLTDIVPTYDGRVEMDFQTTSTISQATTYLSSSTWLRFAHVSAKTFRVNAWGDTYDSTTPVADNTRYKFTYNNLVATLKTGDTTVFTNTFTDTGTTTTRLIINGFPAGGGVISQNDEGIYLYSFKAWDNQGNLIADYVPAVQKGTVPVVGFYDTVSKTFKTATAGTFAAGGEAVPTPDAPMDIVSNNGVLKVRQNLIDLSAVTDGYYYDPQGNYTAFSTSRTTDYIPIEAGKSVTVYFKSLATLSNLNVRINLFNSNKVWQSQEVLQLTPNAEGTKIITPTYNGYIRVSANYSSTAIVDWDTAKIVYGEYTVATIDSAIGQIYADGTVETINVHSRNLLNQNLNVVGRGVASNGTETNASITYAHTAFIKVLPNTTYTMSGLGTVSNVFSKRGAEYSSNNFSSFVKSIENNANTFTTSANTNFVCLNTVVSETQQMLEQGSTATAYAPYYDGGTATAEMLLKVGDYQDAQSILDGVVTRNVGVKVLDGTEDWTASGNLFYAGIATDALEDTHSCYCTHFKGVATNASASYQNEIKVGTNATQTINWTRVQIYPIVGTYSNVTAFKQWLADQYAAGTPVIVVYPLATPTTESVAGQTLQVTDGDNVLEITQASLTGLELEAQYNAAVSLTIQEVQDANLDPNVQVTIQ